MKPLALNLILLFLAIAGQAKAQLVSPQVNSAADNTVFAPPSSPRADYNFNPGWEFFKGDATNAQQIDFDDSKWTSVGTPHTFNDTDTYDELISHSGGERHQYMGIACKGQ